MINERKLEEFRIKYRIQLTNAVTNKPDEYGYTVDQIEPVINKMIGAVREHSFINEGAIKKTIKEITGEYSAKAFYKWLESD